MALTRDLRESVKDRADLDPEFRTELLAEALEAIVCGDVEVSKVILLEYINLGWLVTKLTADNYAE